MKACSYKLLFKIIQNIALLAYDCVVFDKVVITCFFSLENHKLINLQDSYPLLSHKLPNYPLLHEKMHVLSHGTITAPEFDMKKTISPILWANLMAEFLSMRYYRPEKDILVISSVSLNLYCILFRSDIVQCFRQSHPAIENFLLSTCLMRILLFYCSLLYILSRL